METFCLTVESFLYFAGMQAFMSKIMDHRQKRKPVIFIICFLHACLLFVGIKLGKTVFIFAHSIIQILQIVLVKMTWKRSKLSSVLGFYLTMYSVNSILSILIETIFLLSEHASQISELVLHFLTFGAFIAICSTEKACVRIRLILQSLSSRTKLLLLSFAVGNAWFLSLILSSSIMQESLYFNVLFRITIVLMSALLFVLLPTVIVVMFSNSRLKYQNDLFQKNIETQAKNYSDLAKANFELRRFKHDFNNIKIGIRKALSDNDCETALSMVENIDNEIRDIAHKRINFDTGNGIVNALLSDKQDRASKSNTRIVFSGSVPPSSIDPVDLCVLFGNTLDNAIEACEALGNKTEKVIFVCCQCNSGFAFVSVTNPVESDVLIHGNSIESTKADKNLHGYGLYSLNKTVKKLDGSLKLSCENKIFRVEIDISIEQKTMYA